MNKKGKDAPIIDSHCHLDFPEFEVDFDKVMERAESTGVTKFLTICTKRSSLEKVIQIAEKYDNVFFAVGSHPLNVASKDTFNYNELMDISKHKKMVGIGETGLDYLYSKNNKCEQKEHFRLHISIARDSGLPLIVHSRKADDDMSQILTEEFQIGKFDCVMHCFSSGKDLAFKAINLGFYLSISGIATFAKSEDLRLIFNDIPINRLLIETDCPYLAPPPKRGKRNEPSFLNYTAKIMAEYLKIPIDDFRNQTTKNFHNLFKKAKN